MILKRSSFPIQHDPESSDLPRCTPDSPASAQRGIALRPGNAAALPAEVNGGGRRAVDRGRPGASATERAADTPDPIRDAFRAAGYQSQDVDEFAHVITSRSAELNAL